MAGRRMPEPRLRPALSPTTPSNGKVNAARKVPSIICAAMVSPPPPSEQQRREKHEINQAIQLRPEVLAQHEPAAHDHPEQDQQEVGGMTCATNMQG